jgi:hypothetical protein
MARGPRAALVHSGPWIGPRWWFTEGSPDGAPMRGTSLWLRKKGEGMAVILTGCRRG